MRVTMGNKKPRKRSHKNGDIEKYIGIRNITERMARFVLTMGRIDDQNGQGQNVFIFMFWDGEHWNLGKMDNNWIKKRIFKQIIEKFEQL
ncbi:hypothetical protein WA026_010187 [Henosepilachna vigintioctopunctata]|uniref:Uncharacterized protein n=1 Tax=Henosepilachna vigintioctopunctata TaxID=420089 RepID=A0AAW1UBE0_9CUCU